MNIGNRQGDSMSNDKMIIKWQLLQWLPMFKGLQCWWACWVWSEGPQPYLPSEQSFGEEETPEDYFKRLEVAVRTRPRWKVLRQLTLGFLAFGKLAIWADLWLGLYQGRQNSTVVMQDCIWEVRSRPDQGHWSSDGYCIHNTWWWTD